MRLACVCICASIVACGGGSPISTDSTSETSVTSATMTVPSGTTGGSTGDTPTQASAEGTATEAVSGTTTGTTAGPGTSTGPGSTEPPQTGTGPDDTTTPPDETSSGPGETGTSAPGTSTTDGETGTTEDVEACPCPDLDVPLDDGIFVLSKTAALWKFFPDTNTFTNLGAVQCGLAPSTFSMGVDREGFAWVQFSDLQIRKVDVTDPSNCSDPGFVPLQDGVENFGMAFVSNSVFDKCDRIYGNHYNGVAQGDMVSEFFSIDPVTLDLVQLGLSDYGLAEVTGTGDGRAFLFAGPDPSELVAVDKQSGATLEVVPLPGVKTGGGFAFAFFAGDFYFFTDAESDMTSEVTHLDYDDSDNDGQKELTVVVQDAPLRIVGAGVSTCVPLVPQ